MASTITKWHQPSTPEVAAALENQIQLEIQAGNVNDVFTRTVDEVTEIRTVERHSWISLAAAENWIAFCETMNPGPVSVQAYE